MVVSVWQMLPQTSMRLVLGLPSCIGVGRAVFGFFGQCLPRWLVNVFHVESRPTLVLSRRWSCRVLFLWSTPIVLTFRPALVLPHGGRHCRCLPHWSLSDIGLAFTGIVTSVCIVCRLAPSCRPHCPLKVALVTGTPCTRSSAAARLAFDRRQLSVAILVLVNNQRCCIYQINRWSLQVACFIKVWCHIVGRAL